MEGSTLITINVWTLDDEAVWSYTDLQGLCKKLNLGAKGKRSELIERLQSWHKLRDSNRRAGLAQHEGEAADPISWIPLNVVGSNFTIFSQNIRAREIECTHDQENQISAEAPEAGRRSSSERLRRQSLGGTHRGTRANDSFTCERVATSISSPSSPTRTSCRSPKMGDSPRRTPQRPSQSSQKKRPLNLKFNNDDEAQIVSPTLLRPLTTAPGTVGTPGRSILKQPSSPRATLSVSKICFSPFNGTKVIPNRRGVGVSGEHDLDDSSSSSSDGSQDRNCDVDEDLEDWDENFVDSIARKNAEINTQLCAEEKDSDDEDGPALWERID